MPRQKQIATLRRQHGKMLAGIFIGIVLGILISAGVVLYMNKMPIPFLTRVLPAPLNERGDQPPLPLPGKPGDPVLSTTRPAVPASALPSAATSALPPDVAIIEPPPVQSAGAKPPQYIQAGSYTQPQDADKMKAALAMMGLEADIQQVMLQNKTHYRLRLGPYAQPQEADRVRAELAQAGIETVIVRE